MNKIERARELRKNQTDAERKLWQHLRNRNLLEFKFRRQHTIGPYVVDFVCLALKLVVELDGSQHMQNEEYDQRRARYLNEKGYEVFRFWNNDILERIDSVLEAPTLTLSQREREFELRS
ncbi:MAG: DUF559 domain-containing protein [Chromatiales bacterium]|jgi:very-short-patch-repair endonuclease